MYKIRIVDENPVNGNFLLAALILYEFSIFHVFFHYMIEEPVFQDTHNLCAKDNFAGKNGAFHPDNFLPEAEMDF